MTYPVIAARSTRAVEEILGFEAGVNLSGHETSCPGYAVVRLSCGHTQSILCGSARAYHESAARENARENAPQPGDTTVCDTCFWEEWRRVHHDA